MFLAMLKDCPSFMTDSDSLGESGYGWITGDGSGVEPAEKMLCPGRRVCQTICSVWALGENFSQGAIGITSIAAFVFYYDSSDLFMLRLWHLTLILTQLLHVFECRSEYRMACETGLTGNLKLFWAVVVSFSPALYFFFLFLGDFKPIPLKKGLPLFLRLGSSLLLQHFWWSRKII